MPTKQPKKVKPKVITPPVKRGKYKASFFKNFTENDVIDLADEMLDYFKANNTAIHIVSFSTYKLINRQKIYQLAASNEYFAECLRIVKDIIIERLLKFGLAGKNAAFPIFALINISEGEFTNEKHREDNQEKDIIINVITQSPTVTNSDSTESDEV